MAKSGHGKFRALKNQESRRPRLRQVFGRPARLSEGPRFRKGSPEKNLLRHSSKALYLQINEAPLWLYASAEGGEPAGGGKEPILSLPLAKSGGRDSLGCQDKWDMVVSFSWNT